jgi:penicillin-binding protein 1A
LTQSKNIPTVRLADQLGPSAVVDFAHRLGIESPLSPNLSISLGAAGTTLLEMVSTYAVFANQGKQLSPYAITTILDRNDMEIWRPRPAIRPSMTPEQSAIVVDMLQGAICEGTGKTACGIPMPVAGKTGTTNDYKDALFIGFSPETAAGVWVGMDDFSTLGEEETGARAALPVWIDFMVDAHEQISMDSFQIPNNMEFRWLDPISGRKSEEEQYNAVKALFVIDSEMDREKNR